MSHVCRLTSHDGFPNSGWVSEQEGGDLFFFEAGEGAEFIDADIGPVRLIELLADAGQQAAGGSFILTRDIRHIFWIDDNPVRDGIHKGRIWCFKIYLGDESYPEKKRLRGKVFFPYLG